MVLEGEGFVLYSFLGIKIVLLEYMVLKVIEEGE